MAAVLLALLGHAARSDVSSVDVFVHGEHPLCACIRIPSLVATNTTLVAFAECRAWSGDGCDPLHAMGAAAAGAAGLAADGVATRIVMKTSTSGGARWSPLTFLVNASSQPTAVWDPVRGTIFFMFQSHTDAGSAYLMQSHGPGATSWSAPRCVVSKKQERNQRPIFPGPGNAIVLSPEHASHPGRLVFPAWLGPDGPATSASLFFSDDGGETFGQTATTWPKDGNDESTVAELASGELLYLTRASYGDVKHRLGVARSTDAGLHFTFAGRHPQLSGTPDDISLTSLAGPLPFAKNYFAWRPEKNMPCAGSGTEVRRWGSTPTATGSALVVGGRAGTNRTARASWANLSITSASGAGLWIEGGGAAPGQCGGAASYSDIECGAHLPGKTGSYASTCFDLLPLHLGTGRPLRYGDAVLLQEHDGGKFLNPADARFTATSAAGAAAAWTLVSAERPDSTNSTATFEGAAFALRPGVRPPPYGPPSSPTARANRTLFLSHSENLEFTSRTNGTVRASGDGGISFPWVFRATLGTRGSVFRRQAFGYSCLSPMPARSPFGNGAFIGMLWESSTTDCTGMDASCAVKFSVVPGVPASATDTDGGWVYQGSAKSASDPPMKADDSAGIAPPVCRFPSTPTAAQNTSSRAQPLIVNATCSAASFLPGTPQLRVSQSGARHNHPHLYTDTREVAFDMSPRSSFVGAGRVKVASIQRPQLITDGGDKTGNIQTIITALRAAKHDGAAIVTLSEEVFGEERDQPIDGPGPTAIRHAAKDIGIAVVCPMRLRDVDGRQYNAAIVIHANGSLAKAVYTGSEMTQKQFPVFGWPVGAGSRIQQPEMNAVPGQTGTSVFDIPGVGRIAIVMCFDANFPEAWYGAYAMGAQIVFWPTVMGAPDRDVISYARLFRFHVVACGHSDNFGGTDAGIPTSGMILDTTGETVADIKPLGVAGGMSSCGGGNKCSNVVTGTVDLDAEWVHENGPGTNCQVLQAICRTYPGVFEFIIAGCGGETQGKGGLTGCTTRAQTDWWQRGTSPSNSVMLFASKQPRNKTVRAAFEEVTVAHGVKVVPWRDYIFTNRQGINSLRQHGLPILPWLPGDEQQQDGAEGTEAHAIRAGVAPGTCQFPGQHIGPKPVFNRTSGTLENPSRSSFLTALRSNLTCSTGVRSAAPVQLAVEAAETAPQQIYRDVHEFTYDMSPRTSFADAGRVKVASVPGAGGPIDIPTAIAQLKAAKADGALIATLTEEAFGESPGQPIDGPGPTAIRHAAKDIGIAVVCPMRLRDVDGRQYNAAIVIHANGSLAKAVYTGSEMTQKQFPVYGYPLEAPGEAHCQEHNVVPRQTGTSVFDMPGIGRIAIVMCFDVNFPEAWHGAYAMGAQIVFWPTVMGVPDRDVISYARLFRFHVVACGSRRLDSAHMDVKESGMILDTTGETVSDIKVLPSKVVTGTVDLDAEWLHENGPGLITDPSLTRICAAYPGIFEFIIDSDPNRHPGCSRRIYNETDPWQRGTAPDNSAFLFASKFPEIKTVKEAFEEEGLVPWRDYIFGARKGVNSLRLFGLPGLAWGGVEKGPLPAPPLPPLPLPRPLGNVVTAAIITTPELMNPSVVPTSASAVVRAVIEEYANSSQSLALIDATKMTAAQLKPFKVAIVLVALPSSDTLLEFAAAGGSVLVVGGSCRSDTKLQAALGISMNRTADIRTTNADLNVTTRTDKFADAWNLKLPTSRGPSMPVTLSPVSITPNAESFEIANVTIGGATHPWLVARRFGSQYGMLNYLSVPEPIAVRSAVKFIFSSTGLGAYMSRTARAEEYTTDQYGEPISVDDPWSQVAVDHVPASLGLPHRYRVTLLKADPSRWTTKKEYKVMHNKSLCINLYTRWYGRQAPGTVVANIGDGINVVAAQTYRYTTACVSLTHTDNTALARQTAMRSVSPAAPAAHPNSFCCGMSGPSTCSDNAYKYVGNVSVQQCASECAKLRCPCFDYIAKIAHPGFSNCRVLPANVSFKVDSSPSGETAYTTGGTVPVPPPPAAPSSLHLPVSFELLGPLPEDPAGCKSDLDCELNGICSTNAVGAAGARRCECDAGWYGPTCGRLDLLPAHRGGIWPAHRGQTAPFGAAPAAGVGRRTDQAMSWGGSVVQDRETKKFHGFFDTGCFDTNSMQHCSGYQLAHGVSDSLDEPFELHSIPLYVGPEKTAAKSAFNPHANYFPDDKGGGDYVLFFTAVGGMPHGFGLPNPPPYLPVCSGAEVPGRPTQPNASATYVPPTGSCDISTKRDGMGTVCALHAKSLDGPWALKGVFAVAGGAMGGCNPVATPLRNGSVLFASGIGGDQSMRLVPGANEERLGLSISDRGWDGTYHAVPAFPKTYPANAKTGILWPELNEPTEDQTLWQDKRGFLHILMHGNQWAGEWPSMHAYSRDGSPGTWQLSKRTDGHTPYSANVSWAEGGWTNFFRRERPELNFNEHGEPAFLVNSAMFGRDYPTRQFSFTILQRVRNSTTPQ